MKLSQSKAGGKLLYTSSILFAELMATWMGVKAMVMELNTSHIWLEGDSIIVIN